MRNAHRRFPYAALVAFAVPEENIGEIILLLQPRRHRKPETDGKPVSERTRGRFQAGDFPLIEVNAEGRTRMIIRRQETLIHDAEIRKDRRGDHACMPLADDEVIAIFVKIILLAEIHYIIIKCGKHVRTAVCAADVRTLRPNADFSRLMSEVRSFFLQCNPLFFR